jgi:hypothetical protein
MMSSRTTELQKMLLWVDDMQGNETRTAMETKATFVLAPCAVQLQIGYSQNMKNRPKPLLGTLSPPSESWLD